MKSNRTDRVEIGGYVVEYDSVATADSYSRFTTPAPEQCLCWYCRNWVAGRGRLLPDSVRALLDRLGVPPTGEIEVWEAPADDQAHLYGGWYMIVGRLIARPPEPGREFSLGGWQLSWSAGPSYGMTEFGDHEVCELHFTTTAGDFIPREFDSPS